MAIESVSPSSAWGSRWTFSLALAAVVIGLGNLWRVPSAMVNYGGGAFLLVYVLALLLIAVPVIMAELAMARRCLMSPVPTLKRISEGSAMAPLVPWAGRSMMVAATILLGLYGVVGGMGLAYLFRAALGELHGSSANAAAALFARFHGSQLDLGFWVAAFLLLVIAVSLRGLQRGLQRSLRTVMPLMMVVIVILAVVGVMSGKAGEASWTLFAFRWSELGWAGAFNALWLAFFSLAIGTGAVMTLGAYMPGNASVPVSGIGVAIVDLVVTLVLGLAVVALLYARQVASVPGFELVFIAMPQVFAAMPAGQLVGSLFYVLVVLLAWTSALFVMEVLVARISEYLGGLRVLAVLVAVIPGGISAWLAVRGMSGGPGPDFFFWMTQLAALLFIPVAVLGVALLSGRFLHPKRVVSFVGLRGYPFRAWRLLTGILVPGAVVLVMGFGLYTQGRSMCGDHSYFWCHEARSPVLNPYPISEEPHGSAEHYDSED